MAGKTLYEKLWDAHQIEDLGDGTLAIFLPSVPAATIGQVRIVPEERVSPLKASMHATLEAVTMFGVGSSKLVDGEALAKPAAPAE